MRKPEQRVWDAMKAHRPAQAVLERIENGVGTGTADVHGIARGVTVWFELKALRRPKRLSTRFFPNGKLGVSQVAWHRQYATHGGRSYILVRDDLRQLYLFPGGEIHLARDIAVEAALQRYAYVNWDAIFMHAFRRPD